MSPTPDFAPGHGRARQSLATPFPPDLIAEIRTGLSCRGQKTLPSWYLYDDLGSALFEAICHLPQYGLWRAGARLLLRNGDAIAALMTSSNPSTAVLVAELGSGNGSKTRHLLERLAAGQPVAYHAVDVSARALGACAAALSQVPGVSVRTHEATYLDGLREVAANRIAPARVIVLFLGSTIGNFEPAAGKVFLAEVREQLVPGDGLFLAADLVKPVPALLSAYDDPLGLTAVFNMNLLARLNRELGGTFSLTNFRHEARWNDSDGCIEMQLRSVCAQEVRLRELGLRLLFSEDETILTERCHKFTKEALVGMGERAGFRCVQQWVDEEWPFAQTLFTAA